MSSRIVDLTARVLQVERERDALFRANLRMRDKLLEWARNCKPCSGTGCRTIRNEGKTAVVPCDGCHDIRELLLE